MPGLILHTGPPGNYYYFFDKIIEHLRKQPDSFIYLLPVNRAVRYLTKKLVLNTTDHIIKDPHIFTFNSLTRYIYQFVSKPRKIIPRTMRLMLIDQILKEQGLELTYFKNQLPTNSGFINHIDQMLDEFCEFGYQPKDFAQPPPTCREKYKDFGRILSSLHTKYNDQLLDERGVIVEAVQACGDHTLFQQIFPKVQFIYISCYGIYTPPMIEFIKKVINLCQVEIKLEYNEQNQELFAHTRPAFDELRKFSSAVIKAEPGEHSLYQNFFKILPAVKPASDSQRKYTCRILKNKEQEVAFIAATVKKLHQQTGLPLHQFGITFPDLENYAPLIRNVFKDAGLAYNLSTGFALAQSSLIQSYLQVLIVVMQGFDCEQIYALLLSPLINCGGDIAPTWKRLVRQMRMKYLSSDWQQQVQAYINHKKDQQVLNEEETDVEYLLALEKMMSGLPPLIHSLQSLPASAPAVLLKEHFIRVLSELGMLNWLEHEQDYLERQEQERIYRAFNCFIKILEQLTWILQFQWQDNDIPLSDYCRYLKLLIQQESYNLREWSNYGVQIMPRLEIQALECKYLFIGGLLEGSFPRHFRRDIFFNDLERQQMGLTAAEDVLAQDRFLFYQLLASTAEHVYLTCPRFSDDIELLASTFLASLKDATPVQTGNDTLLEVFAQTSATFSAYLSANLKSGLAAEQLEWFKDWLVVTSQPAATYWLTGVDNAYRKLNRSGRNRHEGNLQDSPVAVQLLQQTFAAKPFSITALESYAFCPMQYFLNRILQLEEEEEIEAEITALEKGSLVHRILFRFYTKSADKKSILNPDEPLGLLLKIAKEEFDRLPYSGLLWTLEKEIYFGREGVPGLWEKFIDLERAEISASGFHPAHFEVAFGRAGGGRYQDPLSSPRPVTIQQRDKKVRLVGKIDRVDINQLQQCFIFDYKISSRVDNITIEDLYQGSSLQLPVYLHVIGRLLPEVVPVAAGYYQVRDADHCQRYTVFADSGGQTGRFDKIKVKTLLPVKIEGEEITLDYLIRRSLDFVIDYTENISRGKFYHTNQPEDARCQNYCPYNKICRKDVAKLKALTASAEN